MTEGTIARPCNLLVVVERPATQHTIVVLCTTRRITEGLLTAVGCSKVLTSLKDITVHIVQTPQVGQFLADTDLLPMVVPVINWWILSLSHPDLRPTLTGSFMPTSMPSTDQRCKQIPVRGCRIAKLPHRDNREEKICKATQG